MNRIREFYLLWRFELAFVIFLCVWIRLNRYEFQYHQNGLFVFDKWTTRVDKALLSKERFVSDPVPR